MKNLLAIILCSSVVSIAANYTLFDANGKKLKDEKTSTLNENVRTGLLRQGLATPVYIKKTDRGFKYGVNLSQHLDKRSINVAANKFADTVWVEAEKNEWIDLCIEDEFCQMVQAPQKVSVYSVIVRDNEEVNRLVVNIAVGMKYLDLNGKKLKIGYNTFKKDYRYLDEQGADVTEPDPERFVQYNSVYLVDKYPVTNCEFYGLMKDEMLNGAHFENGRRERFAKMWKDRAQRMNNLCSANDSAANSIYLYQALLYANKRSIAEGLEPFYIINKTNEKNIRIWPDSSFTIYNSELPVMNKEVLKVSINQKSNGYRLPFYDEWMFLARGEKNEYTATWGDSSASINEVLKHAWFGDTTSAMLYASKPVGMLNANGYGLYDVFGLVDEFVLFPGQNPFKIMRDSPSCLKGGNYRVQLSLDENKMYIDPYWKSINFGYSKVNFGFQSGGFRLVRKVK